MPPNLRYVVSQVISGGGRSVLCRRNFCSNPPNGSASSLSKGKGTGKMAWFVNASVFVLVGYKTAQYRIGDKVAQLEEARQKIVRAMDGESAEIVDLRENMWADMLPFVRKS